MSMPVSNRLRQWPCNNGLEGYLQVADVEPHPRAAEIVRHINMTKVTNEQVRRFEKNSVRKQIRKTELRQYANLMESSNIHSTRERQTERKRKTLLKNNNGSL